MEIKNSEKPIIQVCCFIILISTSLWANSALAQCPGFSWLTELHAKNKSINCQAAAREISSVFSSIVSALKSGRTVEVKDFGQFLTHSSTKKIGVNQNLTTKRIRFKSDANLLSELNQSDSSAKKFSYNSR